MIATPFPADHLDVAPGVEATLEAASPPPTLITEQQVAFATAAAAPVPSPTVRWWAKTIHAVRAASSMRRTPRAKAHRPRPYYPRHYGYLENARMAREMDRL
ncbi:hypothetical protein [Mycobacterium sp.]|uniref:hypothetical protein n=1 Tax=Mycobacterium sp. TaxID=1785 RepID=UPI001221D6D3|nr:hypothetical protein [Mycobacterium sp.]TAM67876.1 MAG: hypothetical protein EPN51_12670 [Mycobacterium sp.]